ncbi:PucR family transcriptional regulator ligand-binding domain-containing protein [Streptomyces asoensis]|uniref:PucR family transcriptional regulator n=1 Tax=Streptomyces asoensis TaxID=249586 RepID=UPI0033F1AB2C
MLTVGALVALRELGLSVLVTGPREALETEISWVHTTELPDPSGYIGRTDLVLTNGLWMSDVSSAAFVRSCYEAGATGIVFGLLESAPKAPPALIEACREENLLLLQLPIEVPFTAVTQAAADIRAADRQAPLITSLRRADAFADALAADEGAEGVLRVLRKEDHGLPLALVDRTGTLLAAAGAQLTEGECAVAARALSRKPPPLELVLDSGTATLLPVGAIGRPDAALLCLLPVGALSEHQQGALSQASHFMALEMARRQAVRASEERFAHELTDMIVSGVGSAADITRRLAAFGLDTGAGALAVLVISGRTAATMSELSDATRSALSDRGVPAMIASGSQDIIIICTWRQQTETLLDWCRHLADDLSAYRPLIATADPAKTVASLRTAMLEARRTSQVLARVSHDFNVACLTDLPTYHLLLSKAEPQLLQHLTSILAPLRQYDDRHAGSALETTLRTFFEHQGSPTATARAMHLHINSLYRRLDRIRAVTGRDLSTLQGRLDLLLALEANTFLDL